jgi:predicted porin
MKHSIFVAAIGILAAGSALAQSSVTIYGRLNVTAEDQSVEGVKTKVLNNNASRLGFSGVEDLGGGLKATFLLEHRFAVDTGATSASDFYAGDSVLGLSGGFGTLRMGRITSEAYYATADYIGMINHDTGTSADALYAYIGDNKNTIAYNTDIGALSLYAAVSAGEGRPGVEKTMDLAARYDLGALKFGFGYQKQDQANQYAVRASYEMGAATIGAYVQRDKNVYGSGNRTNFRLTGMYVIGAGELHASYGKADDYSNINDSDASQITLGYNYNLSKRTKVYGYVNKNSAGESNPYLPDSRNIAVGVRHNF